MTARPATARIRRILLLALIAVMAAVGVLYLFGRQRPAAEEPETKASAAASSGDRSDVVAASDAFDYTQTIEGEPVFNIHGDSFSTGRDALVNLSGVRVEVYRQGKKYAIASESATYDPNIKEAVLSGGARLEGEDGLQLQGKTITLGRGGELVTVKGPVRMEQTGRWHGRARTLQFDVATDLLSMKGGVHLESAPEAAEPMTFETDRLDYDRRGKLLTMPETVTVRRSADHLQAGNGELFFDEQGNRPVLLSLRGGVAGSLADGGGGAPGRTMLVQATRLSLRFEEGPGSRPREATLEGQERDLALVESVGTNADLIQGLASKAWVVRFANGVPTEAESSDPVHFAEYHRGVRDPVRSGRADTGRIEFGAAGSVDRIALVGKVELSDPEFRAWGDRALFDAGSGRAEILGPKARVESARGDLAAPHIVWVRETGVLTGTGGTHAVLRDDGGGTMSGLGWDGSGPVEVQAGEATLTSSPRGFSFRESVRAWRGKNLLLAAQLRGDEADRRLAASGKVKTVWVPEPAAGETAPPSPVEVTSETLVYSEASRRLVYSGNVVLKQQARLLSCAELVAELDEGGKITRMSGSGRVALRDPESGRRVDGASADYDVASSSVMMAGDPVVLQDSDGTILKGRRLRYDLKSGSAQLLGAES
jgi:lipopolysaccharide transport protein LptA